MASVLVLVCALFCVLCGTLKGHTVSECGNVRERMVREGEGMMRMGMASADTVDNLRKALRDLRANYSSGLASLHARRPAIRKQVQLSVSMSSGHSRTDFTEIVLRGEWGIAGPTLATGHLRDRSPAENTV